MRSPQRRYSTRERGDSPDHVLFRAVGMNNICPSLHQDPPQARNELQGVESSLVENRRIDIRVAQTRCELAIVQQHDMRAHFAKGS